VYQYIKDGVKVTWANTPYVGYYGGNYMWPGNPSSSSLYNTPYFTQKGIRSYGNKRQHLDRNPPGHRKFAHSNSSIYSYTSVNFTRLQGDAYFTETFTRLYDIPSCSERNTSNDFELSYNGRLGSYLYYL
jgi:hypothetical protein